MHPASEQHIPDGLLAANVLLAENSRQGSATSTHAMYPGFGFAISSTSLGIIGPLYDGRVWPRYTGKERDTESGNDYFGARYYGSTGGRFLSPDPLMASAKVWDPQTWNRYTYGRNNPLRMIDPTGMAEVDAAACAKDSKCTTVNVNVIYDKNSNGGNGLTDKQKASFDKGQLQNAKDQYGNADIHLNVTYTAGGLTQNDGKLSVSGLQSGALNVVVTDQVGTAVSGQSGSTAVSFINANAPKQDDLPHEMAHQFMGDLTSPVAHATSYDPTGILHLIDNAAADVTNDYGRWVMNHTAPSGGGPGPTIWNDQARKFQQSIQPQTQPH
jgi:RHS repeat-associated protein